MHVNQKNSPKVSSQYAEDVLGIGTFDETERPTERKTFLTSPTFSLASVTYKLRIIHIVTATKVIPVFIIQRCIDTAERK
jgi:hypothetical protein